MFRSLLGAVLADIDRQIRWAKYEVRRQTRHAALKGVLVGVASLAAVGTIVVGLMAFYFWLEMQGGLFAALGVIGGGLLLLALILFALAFARERPGLASPPQLQIMRPAALLGTLRQGTHSGQTIKLAAGPRRHGSRSALLGMLTLATIVGLLAGRRL
jgi:Putative Actinobacterial Holin-X, holin superfamily III